MAQGDRDYYLKTLGIDEYLPKDLIADNELPVVEVLEATVNESSIDEKIEPKIDRFQLNNYWAPSIFLVIRHLL